MAASLIPMKTRKRMVTYYVDTGTVYTASLKKGADALTNLSFTPSLSGYTFIGWRENTTASSTVLVSKIVGSSDITLYAVFAKTIMLTYYATNSTASTTTGTQYYNNGNISNPSFTISNPSLSGWTFLGWIAGSTSATGTVTYSSISSRTFSASATLYAKFSQTITITYYSTSSTAATTSGTRYFNAAGNYSNPSFTISDPSLSGWTFLGWTTSTSATGTVSYSSISATTFSSSTTLYGKFSQTITLSYNGNSSTSGSVSSQTGTRYYNAAGNYSNPSFTLASNGFTRNKYVFSAWASGSASGTQYAVGASVTLSASTVFYAVWTYTDTTVINGTTLNSSYISSYTTWGSYVGYDYNYSKATYATFYSFKILTTTNSPGYSKMKITVYFWQYIDEDANVYLYLTSSAPTSTAISSSITLTSWKPTGYQYYEGSTTITFTVSWTANIYFAIVTSTPTAGRARCRITSFVLTDN